MTTESSNTTANEFYFTAIKPYISEVIPSNEEAELRGKDYIRWGENDDYGNFLFKCYSECPILQAVINGTTDYVAGDDITLNVPELAFEANKEGETFRDVITRVMLDYYIFGNGYMHIVKNRAGKIAELYWLDARYVRSGLKNQVFYYNEDFGKKWGKSKKTVVYPAFIPEGQDAASVLMFKTPNSRGTYGTPVWEAAIKPVMTEMGIDTFHLAEINNNFLGSAIINFNNGNPSPEQKENLEKNVKEKLGGAENAGRIMLSFNKGKDNATTVERLGTDDFDNRYNDLAKKTQLQIYTVFGANANLFGVPTESNGFNAEEYQSSFKLYNRTRVKPVQRYISSRMDRVFQMQESVTIIPFTIEENTREQVVE